MKNTNNTQSKKTTPNKGLFDFSDPDSGLGGSSSSGHAGCSVM
jgi:hypothetical protein